MYDSGGLSLKPSDAVHAQMKNDMSGAAAVLGGVAGLGALGCTTRGHRLPDVHRQHAVGDARWPSATSSRSAAARPSRCINTDAEGRLVMADALVLATEERRRRDRRHRHADRRLHARARAREVAGVFGNDQALVDAGDGRRRRPPTSPCGSCRSTGATAAARLAGRRHQEPRRARTPGRSPPPCSSPSSSATCRGRTSTSPARRRATRPTAWRTTGGTGFGARLLAELACAFRAP